MKVFFQPPEPKRLKSSSSAAAAGKFVDSGSSPTDSGVGGPDDSITQTDFPSSSSVTAKERARMELSKSLELSNSHQIQMYERDVSMDSGFKEDLRKLMGGCLGFRFCLEFAESDSEEFGACLQRESTDSVAYQMFDKMLKPQQELKQAELNRLIGIVTC